MGSMDYDPYDLTSCPTCGAVVQQDGPNRLRHDRWHEDMATEVIPPARTKVRQVACSFCDARPGEPCVGPRKVRAANHRERVDAYLMQRGPV